MTSDDGLIAELDQSGGSTPKALKLYGVNENRYSNDEEMYQLFHQMRTRIIKSPVFSCDKILAVILFENTMDRKIESSYTADFLWGNKGIVPFLKIDKGLDELQDGFSLVKEIPGLDDLLNKKHN